MTLFTHMTALLVYDGGIFEPVAVDYIKALRSLLSYPPHLAHLDHRSWRKLMGICWAGVLGERIGLDPDLIGEVEEDEDEQGDGASGASNGRHTPSAFVTNEIVALIPILLSSANAPLIPRPSRGVESDDPALGIAILLKIHRFLSSEPAVVPLEILRSLNIILGELELNSREQFATAAHKLFPALARLWTSKGKVDLGLREHVLIAMRTLLPFVTHAGFSTHEAKEAATQSMVQVLDNLGKEVGTRAAVKPLELDTLRLVANTPSSRQPFQLMGVSAGFGFDASSAVSWVALDLLADCCYLVFDRLCGANNRHTLLSQYQPQRVSLRRSALASANGPRAHWTAC